MAVTTTKPNSDDTMKILRETLAKKMIGNVMHLSMDADAHNEIFKYSITRLAESLCDAMKSRGLIPSGDASVHFTSPDLMNDSVSLAAKLYAAWSEKPQDLLIFLVQAAEDARQEATQQRSISKQYLESRCRLFRKLSACKTMSDVREALDADED